MTNFISFMYNGHRYVTCHGMDITGFESLFTYPGIFDDNGPTGANRGCVKRLKNFTGVDAYSAPLLQDPYIVEENGQLVGDGHITEDGVEVKVHFDSTGVTFTYPDGNVRPYPPKEDESTLAPIPEPTEEAFAPEPEPEVTPIPAPEVVIEEPVPAPVVEEPTPAPVVEEPTPVVNRRCIKRGVQFGQGSVVQGITQVSRVHKAVGFQVDKTVPQRQQRPTQRPTVQQDVLERQVFSHKEEVRRETIPQPSPEYAEATARYEESIMHPTFLQSAPVQQETPEIPVDDSAEREAAKKAFREKLPMEVQQIIGDIPFNMLGSISEFTMSGIDRDALLAQGDAYCIDHRWHKAGKWFCVDVVNERARYFFNSRRDVSIQIDLATLKEWQQLIGA